MDDDEKKSVIESMYFSNIKARDWCIEGYGTDYNIVIEEAVGNYPKSMLENSRSIMLQRWLKSRNTKLDSVWVKTRGGLPPLPSTVVPSKTQDLIDMKRKSSESHNCPRLACCSKGCVCNKRLKANGSFPEHLQNGVQSSNLVEKISEKPLTAIVCDWCLFYTVLFPAEWYDYDRPQFYNIKSHLHKSGHTTASICLIHSSSIRNKALITSVRKQACIKIGVNRYSMIACSMCLDTFDNLYTMHKHQLKKHYKITGEKHTYKLMKIIEPLELYLGLGSVCVACRVNFSTHSALNAHWRKNRGHHPVYPYNCELLPGIENVFSCPYCPALFTGNFYLFKEHVIGMHIPAIRAGKINPMSARINNLDHIITVKFDQVNTFAPDIPTPSHVK